MRIVKEKLPILARRDRSDEESGASLTAVLGFSIIGLLLTLIIAAMPAAQQFSSSYFLLILAAAPIAAWLGFTLGSPE